MKQIIQDLKNGHTILEEVPRPQVKPGSLLIRTTKSLVSLGTERMLVEFGKANYLQKAKQQPDKVKMVLEKVKSDGLRPTLDSVLNKLNQPLPLGYCNVGVVEEVGAGVSEFKSGDRVASNGHHAEFVVVPKNLVAKIPEGVSDEEACFTVVGSIGLQGIRLLNPTFGETIVVIGLGLIGLVTAELLLANGCRVIGIDFDEKKIKIAKRKGVITFNPREGSDQVKFVQALTSEIGADGVLITASAKGDEIISQAAQMSRKKGRIVLVGVVGLNISRADFYEKELSFQVSCSYGPGRYDEHYEQKGIDYPIGFVRWTEKRNFEAVLHALSSGRLDVKPLITETFELVDYAKIYDHISQSSSIASIISYGQSPNRSTSQVIQSRSFARKKGVIGIIGAGNFTGSTILPNLKKLNADVKYIASLGGLNSTLLAKRFGCSISTTDYQEILRDSDVDLVMITTRHNTHAKFVIEALQAGKDVFVEKPLAINREQLAQISEAHNKHKGVITVGFNRRFSPLATKMKSALGEGNTPINVIATMNAGYIPKDSWVHDMAVGGGRIIGEACHLIDLCSYLTGSLVTEVVMSAIGTSIDENTDNASIFLKFQNGSNAVINYFSNGSKSYSKERVEIYSQDRTIIMDNWRKLKFYGFKGVRNYSGSQDKGHASQFRILLESLLDGGKAPISFESIVNTSQASLAALESLKTRQWIGV